MSNMLYAEGEYLARNPTWHQEDSPWKAKQIVNMLSRHSLDIYHIAEVGCGAGGILLSLSKNYRSDVRYVGYEISPQAYELCMAKQNTTVQFLLGDLLEDKSAIFDLLLAMDVFEHVDDYLGFLRQLKAKAKYHIFHIPLDLHVLSVVRGTSLLNSRRQYGHLHYFTKDTALATLRDCGYHIIDYFYTPTSIELPNRSFVDKVLKWPRRIGTAVFPDFAVRLLGGYSLLVLTN